MPNRILFLVSAVLASLSLPVIPGVAHAADDCLASPDKATPPGGHWRYHIERGTGRKCWYLAGETAKTDSSKADATRTDDATADDSKAATPEAAKSNDDNADATAGVPPKPPVKIKPSLERAAASPPDRPRPAKPAGQPAAAAPASNARAEFIDTPRDDQPAPNTQAQPDGPQATAPDAASPGSVGTRWPSPAGITAADSNSLAPGSSAAGSSALMSAAPAPAPQPAAEPQPAATTDQATPAPTAAVDQAAVPAEDAASGPDYLLYALIAAVTGFVLVVGFAGLRFVVEWWRDWREEQRWRRSQQVAAQSRGDSLLALGEVPMELAPAGDAVIPRMHPQRGFAEEEPPRRLEDEIDQIEQLLALTRQTNVPSQVPSWDAQTPRDAAE